VVVKGGLVNSSNPAHNQNTHGSNPWDLGDIPGREKRKEEGQKFFPLSKME
jgi:hypothetical protein